jgi:diamine N-acetyltransferase
MKADFSMSFFNSVGRNRLMTVSALRLMAAVTERDSRSLAALADEIWREYYPAIIGLEQVEYMLQTFQSPEAIDKQQAQGYRYFFIAVQGDPVGYLSILPDPVTNTLFLSKLYLLRQRRGQGWGRLVLKQLEIMAREQALQRITLTVNKQNAIAIAAYQRMGFSITAAVVTDIKAGFVMDDYRMLKKLA